MLFFPSVAHEGSEGLCWDIAACSDQSAGPDCVLPGSRDQGHTPELLLRPEGSTELTLPGWVLLRWSRRYKTVWLQSDGGRPLLENGEFSVFKLSIVAWKSRWKKYFYFYLLYIRFYGCICFSTGKQASIGIHTFISTLTSHFDGNCSCQFLQYWIISK